MQVKQFAALGAGVIGSGWVARSLAHGLDVTAWDPAPNAEAQLRANVANAWPVLERVGLAKGASFDENVAQKIAAQTAVDAKDARYAGRVIGLPVLASASVNPV